tara:strand:- start:33779 stop:34708 length:930 start_codon:yes stop_codon:yes gene_type:complete
MSIRKGDSLGVFTGGWFDKHAGKPRGGIDVFSHGWFEEIGPDVEISATAQDIVFESGINRTEINYVIWSQAAEYVFEATSVTIEIDDSTDYTDYPALPNGWFTKCSPAYDNEREFYKMTQMEAYNTFGVPCLYYKMEYVFSASDKIWGEKNDRVFSEYWYDVQTSFKLPRENKQWSKFGISDLNNFTMYMSKEHFKCVTSASGENGWIPQQGDLIQTEYNSNIYEITEVKEEAGMYFLDKRYTWELIVTPFKDEFVSITGNVSASPLSAYADKPDDIFDVRNPVDVEKEDIIYKPPAQEKPNNDPWANW